MIYFPSFPFFLFFSITRLSITITEDRRRTFHPGLFLTKILLRSSLVYDILDSHNYSKKFKEHWLVTKYPCPLFLNLIRSLLSQFYFLLSQLHPHQNRSAFVSPIINVITDFIEIRGSKIYFRNAEPSLLHRYSSSTRARDHVRALPTIPFLTFFSKSKLVSLGREKAALLGQ